MKKKPQCQDSVVMTITRGKNKGVKCEVVF